MPDARLFLRGAVITALVALLAVSTDMLAPTLPTLAEAFGADRATVQLTMSAFVAGFAIAHLVYGPLSDRFGRRRVLLGGVSIYLAASIACALASRIELLVVFRFVQALGACAGPVLGRAVVRDIYGREGAARALGYVGVAMGLVPAIAPIIGSHLLVFFGWRSIFALLAAFSFLTLLGVIAVLKESNLWLDAHALKPRRMLANYRGMLARQDYLGYTLAVSFTYAGLFIFLSGSGYVLISELGIPTEHFGYYFAPLALSYMVGAGVTGRFTLRLGIERMIVVATLLGIAAGATMAALAWAGIAQVAAVIAPMCVYLMALGVILPNGMAGAIGPYPESTGAASAMLGFLQLTIGGLAGVAVASGLGWSQETMAAGVALSAVGSFVSFYLLVWRRHAAAAVF